MARFARVVAESKLLQLDREFDFAIPPELQESLSFGNRVSFNVGRSKTKHTGFVVEVMEDSEFATSSLLEAVGDRPVLTREIYRFARDVANRQCVAIGEILSAAIPDHMARTSLDEASEPLEFSGPGKATREVLLANGRQVEAGGHLVPSWMTEFAKRAQSSFSAGFSSLLLVPEVSDVEILEMVCKTAGLKPVIMRPDQKRSERFRTFHRLLNRCAVVIGTRSAIYAPVANLGLICLSDDLDDSWREQGSPNTHTRELALMRAGNATSIFFAAPYRSLELQRLVEMGYLSEYRIDSPPPRLSFTDTGLRLDSGSFELAKQSLKSGPLLVLLPRKGFSAAAYCQSCGERQQCACGGFIWEPSEARFHCRLCGKLHTSCRDCRSANFRRGRTGSLRTVAEIGKAFPNAKIYESTAEKTPAIPESKNTILVSTPGAAPRLKSGYAGLLVLDCDIWLGAQHLMAEQIAMRDWTEALELLAPDARAVFEGLGSHLGQPLALWQHVELAKAALSETSVLKLPPNIRIASVEAAPNVLSEALDVAEKAGAEILRNSGSHALIRFKYSQGMELAQRLRSVAVKTAARTTTSGNRRGLKIVMDDLKALSS